MKEHNSWNNCSRKG